MSEALRARGQVYQSGERSTAEYVDKKPTLANKLLKLGVPAAVVLEAVISASCSQPPADLAVSTRSAIGIEGVETRVVYKPIPDDEPTVIFTLVSPSKTLTPTEILTATIQAINTEKATNTATSTAPNTPTRVPATNTPKPTATETKPATMAERVVAWSPILDQGMKNINLLGRTKPYLSLFAEAGNYPMDPAITQVVNEIIAERGNPAWATDWQTQDYERGFLTVSQIITGDGPIASMNNLGRIILTTEPVFYAYDINNRSPEARQLIADLEYTGQIVKEGGVYQLYRHVAKVQRINDLYEYFTTTRGSAGIGEAITQPLFIKYWNWVKNNVRAITPNESLQVEIMRYADAVIAFKFQQLRDKNIDFNPGFP